MTRTIGAAGPTRRAWSQSSGATPVAKEMMLQVAQDYDRIAEYVWQQARALTEKPDPLSRWRRRSLVHRF
jgi:hypothetical protein